MPNEPRLEAAHVHADGRRTLVRVLNGEAVRQVYTARIRPGVVTAWHAHEHQDDRWSVLSGKLQVGLYDPISGRTWEYWLTNELAQVLTIPPMIWHGYHNPGPDTVVLLNMTTASYSDEHPDELRQPWNWSAPAIGWQVDFK